MGLTIRTLPPFEYKSGGQGLCEHAIAGKPIASGACGADRLYSPILRVQKVKGRS